MHFSCRKWRDHDTTDRTTNINFGNGSIDVIANTTKDAWTTPMTLCHIMMAGSDPLIFYAGFSENSQYQKMEGGSHILIWRQEATDRQDLRKIQRSNRLINTAILRSGNGSQTTLFRPL